MGVTQLHGTSTIVHNCSKLDNSISSFRESYMTPQYLNSKDSPTINEYIAMPFICSTFL